jgi:hypothetical protein
MLGNYLIKCKASCLTFSPLRIHNQINSEMKAILSFTEVGFERHDRISTSQYIFIIILYCYLLYLNNYIFLFYTYLCGTAPAGNIAKHTCRNLRVPQFQRCSELSVQSETFTQLWANTATEVTYIHTAYSKFYCRKKYEY